MSPQPAVSSFLFCNISLAWQLLIFCASNQLQMSGGLSCVHLSLLSSPHAHTGKPESLLFCHVNHSVDLVVLGLGFFGCLFFFFAGAGCGVPSHSPSPLPCSYIPLALEKTSLFNFLPYQDLPLLCYPAMFWLSHFLHVHTNYYMFILINTVEKLLSFYLNCVAGGDFLRADNASASFFIRITPEWMMPLCLSPHWV